MNPSIHKPVGHAPSSGRRSASQQSCGPVPWLVNPGYAAAIRPRYRPPHWVLTTTILASRLAFIDVSVGQCRLSSIGATFRAGASDLQWVINAYLLPLSALCFLAARGDRYGHARLLIAAPEYSGRVDRLRARPWPDVAAGRARTAGVGAALLMPNSLAFSGGFCGEAASRDRHWASVGAVMGALGPVLGGWLIDTFGWRWIFLINLPLAAGAVVLAFIFIRTPPREGAVPALDLLGGVLRPLLSEL